MIRPLIVFALVCLLGLNGCDREEEKKSLPPSPATPTAETAPPAGPDDSGRIATALLESVEMSLHELPSQALRDWYAWRTNRPVLLLYSRDPFLQPVPEQALKRALKILAEEPRPDFGFGTAAPVILPKMALSVALKGGFFSRVVWSIPTAASLENFSVEQFRKQLLSLGAVSEEEARTFTGRQGVFTGRVRGVPFVAVHPAASHAPAAAAVLHFDLSYLQPFYKDGVKTPAFSLVYDILKQIREREVDLLDATFSYSQLTWDIPLGSRFLGPVIAGVFAEPELLDQPLPPRWEQHRKALFLPNFFKYEEARDLYLQMAAANPDDADARYGLYSIHLELKEGGKALEHLARAVEADPVYGLEYLGLTDLALERGVPEKAVEMARRAVETFPENPFIRLRLASLLEERGRDQEAAAILDALQALDWSRLYYPGMKESIAERLAEAK